MLVESNVGAAGVSSGQLLRLARRVGRFTADQVVYTTSQHCCLSSAEVRYSCSFARLLSSDLEGSPGLFRLVGQFTGLYALALSGYSGCPIGAR